MHSLHEQKLFERHTETRRTFQSTAKSRREINFPFPRRRIYICDLKGSSIKSIYIYINDQRQHDDTKSSIVQMQLSLPQIAVINLT